MNNIDPKSNYLKTMHEIGFVVRKEATQSDYDRIGFMSGLEVHQQILTDEKLFCHCPAGRFHDSHDFDAEVIRHMRPTLSELGEYDGTALMEFKTRKTIVYRLKNETTCTYEVDDTPPFQINRQALERAIEISLLSKLNIVGEVHITRKQYLDGSIPTGFQRTAIIGVEGEIYLKSRMIRLIQLSLEEDSCREISDIGHTRVYKTDRLGMPLIETVTYPDFKNPDEVREGCDYIRFLNRSTGKVRTGIGAGRQDVNVSCRGGHRVEIKGVAHTKWIPELCHNEAFRQWALLNVRKLLIERFPDKSQWELNYATLNPSDIQFVDGFQIPNGAILLAVNLPGFEGLLSHFTQPGRIFANELSERLKVIACIDQPNMTHSEDLKDFINLRNWEFIKASLQSSLGDGQVLFWALPDDVKTAIETIDERCRMAFDGIPPETRKAINNGITIFERVLPGADRMYPDTDSAPIPLEASYIDKLQNNLPTEVIERYAIMKNWGIPESTYTYIFSKNFYPIIEKIHDQLQFDPRFLGSFFGHTVKFVDNHLQSADEFDFEKIFDLFEFIKTQGLEKEIAKPMLIELYKHPKMDFESILVSIGFKKVEGGKILGQIPFLKQKFDQVKKVDTIENRNNWIMGQLKKTAVGNINLNDLKNAINA